MRVIETERLKLRGWKFGDLDDLYHYGKNPRIGPAAGWQPYANKAVALSVLHSLMSRGENWAIELRETERVIGSISLTTDLKRGEMNAKIIGYNIAEEQWGNGYATEATKAVVRYGFEVMDVSVIAISHYPFNMRSKRVIEKCGFTYEGTLRHAFRRFDGEVLDLVCYSILREEFYGQDRDDITDEERAKPHYERTPPPGQS